MFSLSTSGDCEVEKEKPRILPNMIPNFAQLFGGAFPTQGNNNSNNPLRNFSLPTTTSSSPNGSSGGGGGASTGGGTNNLFPSLFPNTNNFAQQQFYALLQQNQFMAQFAAAKSNNSNNGNALNGSNNSESNSSVLSDSRASSADSSSKKLKVDNDGNVVCPICDEKLPNDSNWELHVEMERKKLIKSIESIKEQKRSTSESLSDHSMASNRSRQKRELELQRIRSNQQKRLTLKAINPLSNNRTNNTENSASSSPSRSTTSIDKNYCKGCERHHDYLIISSTLDEPRCYECFKKFRQQTTSLPLSITQSPENNFQRGSATPPTPSHGHTVDGILNPRKRHTPPSNDSTIKDESSGNQEKRIKIEVDSTIKDESSGNQEKRIKIEV